MNEVIKLKERINDLWVSIFGVSVCLWFPSFYDVLNETFHTPQLLTGLAGDIFVLIYMLFMLSLWGVLMFKVTKLIRKKIKL
ncbi:TPA: hypothetical protein ACQ75Q_005593 [Bacillus thuringiensis]|uniref:hypothetical protein n=1 Tax=Bacillus cereus TaxID=1396 RepID=UPI000BFDCBBB|nr:hypothetical protein [Bacillus cereus]PGT04928.1 hypothetical protein COD03_30020 [Bacillus cereus]HDR4766650.1 hypothetical protein [Bacillus cereus]HDR4799607.1 hypothetical protein [Bacillus cereus]HDR4805698.1 hypothetical protein [Bacillus cereus]HDR4811669.1 hypothetical protein [Bacillus cereus]